MIIAFILHPLVTLLIRLRMPRSVASFVVCCLALLVLSVLGPGAYPPLSRIYGDLPTYASAWAAWQPQ